MNERNALENYIEASAGAVDLTIRAEHLESTAQALAVLLEQGKILMAFPLEQNTESATQYSP